MHDLRRSAWLIGAAVLFPLLLFFAFQTGFGARDDRRVLESRALARTEVAIAGADAILAQAVGALDALSTIQALPVGDFAQAYARSRQIAANNPNWVSVALLRQSDGAELFDLRRPFGAMRAGAGPLRIGARTMSGWVVREGRGCPCVVLERLAPGPRGQSLVIRVYLAVAPFQRLLPPSDIQYEVSALVTADSRFIARTLAQDERVGRIGSKYLQAAVAGAKRAGIYRGFTLEGFENYTAFTRSRASGWSAHVALNSDYLDDPTRKFVGSLGLAALISLLLAAAMIWFVLRQMADGRRMSDRLQQNQKLEALGQLTGGIAHDFNNLLTPIVGALDFISAKPELDARTKRIARGALTSAERAGKLTSQLLAFSRRQKLDVMPVPIAAMLEEMRPLLEQSVGQTCRLEIDASADADCAWSNLNQLELAILNLVINARDASPSGGTIRLETRFHAERDQVIIRVSDDGTGMDETTRARALEPFFTTKDQGMGTGLGLAQVFALVEQSGGEIDIDSAPGEGTTVSLFLRHCALPETPIIVAGKAPAAPRRDCRILVVDDDPSVRAMIAGALSEDGHAVDSVSDGHVALRAIERERYDLVVVDFAMPAMDGADLIRLAREIRSDTPFLIVTGYSDSRAIDAVATDVPVIHKPLDIEGFLRRVRDLTG